MCTPRRVSVFGLEMLLISGFMLVATTATAGWQREFVDVARYIGRPSLKIDSRDRLHLAHGTERLHYGLYESGEWRFQVVDPDTGSSYWSSLALDSSAIPGCVRTAGRVRPGSRGMEAKE